MVAQRFFPLESDAVREENTPVRKDDGSSQFHNFVLAMRCECKQNRSSAIASVSGEKSAIFVRRLHTSALSSFQAHRLRANRRSHRIGVCACRCGFTAHKGMRLNDCERRSELL